MYGAPAVVVASNEYRARNLHLSPPTSGEAAPIRGPYVLTIARNAPWIPAQGRDDNRVYGPQHATIVICITDHHTASPPSTTMVWPVMKSLSAEAR